MAMILTGLFNGSVDEMVREGSAKSTRGGVSLGYRYESMRGVRHWEELISLSDADARRLRDWITRDQEAKAAASWEEE